MKKCLECGRVYSMGEHGASEWFCSFLCLIEWRKPCDERLGRNN